jgi:uncharacterized membrane protein YvbJ
MPLVTCPDCGKEFSTGAVACPQCGRPNKPAAPQAGVVHGKGEGCFLRTMNIGCVIAFVIGAFILLVVFRFCADVSRPSHAVPSADTAVHADTAHR